MQPKPDLFNPVLGGKSYARSNINQPLNSVNAKTGLEGINDLQKSSIDNGQTTNQSPLPTYESSIVHGGSLMAPPLSTDRSPHGKSGHVEHIKVKYSGGGEESFYNDKAK